ncbi:hypothetical protein, partial [Shinella sp. BYT-45]|uniref:hypothetical protein n=1 Tax=Shinella sp. BYT-45 TaxID=3377377 RepID=UPI00397FC700
MGDRPSDDADKNTILAVVWGTYETLKWYFERHPNARPPRVMLLDPVGNEDAVRSCLPWDETQVTKIAAIPSDRDGEIEMFSYTQPGLFSVQPTTPALQSLFPGLRIRKTVTAEHVSAKTLASALGEEKEGFSLVLETPGAEMSMLEYFEETGLLDQVNNIYLRCGAEVFFNDASDEIRICSWLKDRFFQLVARNDEDADWPQLAFVADINAHRLAGLETRIHELQKAIAERDADLTAAQSGRKQLEKALGKARSQAEADKKAIAERDAALTAAQAGREQLEEALSKARSQAEADKKAIAERDAA